MTFQRLRIYGIIFVILGIISWIYTYKYVLPIGSIFLIISGIIFIFWRRLLRMAKVDEWMTYESFDNRK